MTKKSLGFMKANSSPPSIRSQYNRWDRISESTDRLALFDEAMRMKMILKEEVMLCQEQNKLEGQ